MLASTSRFRDGIRMRVFDGRLGLRREAWAWASYDFANSAFVTTVMAGFFPVFLDRYWRGGLSHGEVFALLAWANAGVAVAVMLLAPLLGAIADQGAHRKRFLTMFMLFGVTATGLLAWPGFGMTLPALVLFGVASLGYIGGNVFYNSLLPHVAAPGELDRVSALGYSVGYLGGGLLFALNVAMVAKPHWFGLTGSVAAVKIAFVLAALWWGAFALWLIFGVHEPRQDLASGSTLIAGLSRLRELLGQLRRVPVLAGFLLVYWLYIDGVNSVFKLAVGYGLAVGLPADSLLLALLLVQIIGFPAALGFGWLGERFGPRVGIMLGLCVYVAVVSYAAFIRHPWQFFMLAVLIGLVQGGTQSLSRSLYARLVPPGESGAYFGLYGLVGKFSAVLGPVMVAVVQTWTGNARLAIVSIAVLFLLGLGGLWLLPLDRKALSAAGQRHSGSA